MTPRTTLFGPFRKNPPSRPATRAWRALGSVWVCLAMPGAALQAQNLLKNPGFEQGLDGWRVSTTMKTAEVRLADDGAGGTCALIHKSERTGTFSLVGISQTIDAEPNAAYELSFRYRSEGPVSGSLCVQCGEEGHTLWWAKKWTAWRRQFRTGAEPGKTAVAIQIKRGQGDVWVDDVQVRQVGRSYAAAALETGLELGKGAWRIQVFGKGGGKATLWPGAVQVRLGQTEHVADLHTDPWKHQGRAVIFFLDRPTRVPVTVRKAPGYAGAPVVDRVLVTENEGPGRIRPLYLDTTLVVAGRPNAVIVASDEPAMQQAARDLRDGLQRLSGAALPIVNDRAWMAGNYRGRAAIAVGNLMQNKLSERLYCLWYTREDGWYPGPGGWVVRTVHNPWGSGANVVVAAGSDAAGTQAAGQQLLAMFEAGPTLTIGHTINVKTDPDIEQRILQSCGWTDLKGAADKAKRTGQRALMGKSTRLGMSYLYTGRPDLARAFLAYLRENKSRAQPHGEAHMQVWETIRAWDTVEECPALSDDDRLDITNYLYDTLRSPDPIFVGWLLGSFERGGPKSNHSMLAAMDAYYGADYFGRYYAFSEAEDWLEKARFLFAGQELEDKSGDDSGNYEGSTDFWPLLPFAYTEPGYRFLPSGTARRFMDRMCMVLDNRFAASGYGDCWNVDLFYPFTLAVGAWYYRDGRYQYILDRRRASRPREQNALVDPAPFRMAGFVKPEPPADLEGVVVAMLNSNCWGEAGNVPDAQKFDKLSFRTRFEPDKQYLLLDGLGGWGHGDPDANCIIRCTDNDRVWLVDDSFSEGNNLIDHNAVAVAREGFCDARPPPLARLDAAFDSGTVGLTRTVLPGYTGTDWERNIVWLREKGFVVLDRMHALEPGNYSFRCLWRTLGTARIEGNRFVTAQDKETPDRRDRFHIVNGGDVASAFTPDDGGFGSRWRGYAYAEPIVNIHSQDVSRRLGKGETFTFVNLLYAANVEAPCRLDMAKLDTRAALVGGDVAMLVGLADGGYEAGGLAIEAGPFALRADGLTAALARSIALNGRAWFAAAVPVAVSIDPAAGECVVEAPADTEVRIAGTPCPVQKGRNVLRVAALKQIPLQAVLEAARAATPPASARRPPAETAAPLSVAWSFDAGSSVRDVALDARGLVVGTGDGAGIILDANGREQGRIRAERRVTAVALGDLDGDGINEAALGAVDRKMYAFDRTGKPLWTFECPPDVELGNQQGAIVDVLVADLDGDGKAEAVASASNHNLYFLDARGKELRRIADHKDPRKRFDNLLPFDADGDGTKEVFAFPTTGGFGRWFEFHLNGKKRVHQDKKSTHMRDAALGDIDGDGRPDLAVCTTSGNVHYGLANGKRVEFKQVQSFGTGGTALAVQAGHAGGSGLVAVAVEMSYIHVLDRDGKIVWRRPTDRPVTDLAFFHTTSGARLAAGTVDGAILVFDLNGEPLGRFAAPARINVLASLDGRLAAGCDDGKLLLLKTR
ncbi:MAG: hypothetical protein JXR37_04040 [Kiritimatiellae bacterium]|nr:hypothetical protein [Kiritimatiellia bacterium]